MNFGERYKLRKIRLMCNGKHREENLCETMCARIIKQTSKNKRDMERKKFYSAVCLVGSVISLGIRLLLLLLLF